MGIKRVNFFCCKDDLILIIQNIEKSLKLKYVAGGVYSSINDVRLYTTLLDYENLGTHKSGEHQDGYFLIVEATSGITLDEFRLVDGSIRYSVNQLKNPGSIIFHPGGIYENRFLVHGQVSTISTSYIAQRLIKVFQKEIKRQCPKKNGVFYYSEEVKHLYDNGVRLITISTKSPIEYDLKI